VSQKWAPAAENRTFSLSISLYLLSDRILYHNGVEIRPENIEEIYLIQQLGGISE